jgi:putative transposase
MAPRLFCRNSFFPTAGLWPAMAREGDARCSVILLCTRWYLAYNLNLRNLEEMMVERGISVDPATISRWIVRFSPELLEQFNQRNLAAAKRFLSKALMRHGRPERIVIDGSQTNREAIMSWDATNRLQNRSRQELKPIHIRQSRYLNNRIEQDHRAVKRRIRPMLGCKSVNSPRAIIGGIEMIHMMRKGQAKYACNLGLSLAEQFERLTT